MAVANNAFLNPTYANMAAIQGQRYLIEETQLPLNAPVRPNVVRLEVQDDELLAPFLHETPGFGYDDRLGTTVEVSVKCQGVQVFVLVYPLSDDMRLEPLAKVKISNSIHFEIQNWNTGLATFRHWSEVAVILMPLLNAIEPAIYESCLEEYPGYAQEEA